MPTPGKNSRTSSAAGDLEDVTDEDLSGPKIDRRTTLKLLSAAGVTTMAGCLGGGGGGSTTTAPPADDDDGDNGDGSTDGDGSDPTPTATATPAASQRGGRLKAAWNVDEIYNLDPQNTTSTQLARLEPNIFDGPLRINPDLTFTGNLASDWEVIDGGQTITFDLRENVTFHNGKEFTADDLAYTIKRNRVEDTTMSGKISTLQSFDEGGVQVDGDYSLTLNFKQPFAPILSYMTAFERAAAVVEQGALEENRQEFVLNPVGTGPFKVTEHNVGNELVLDRHEDYHLTDADGNQLPYLDGVDVSPIPEATTLINAVKTGSIQITDRIPIESVSQIEQTNNVEARSKSGPAWQSLVFNLRQEPFDSNKVRLGIAKLIDNEAYVEDTFFGNAVPAKGPLPPAIDWCYREDKPDDQAFAPEEGRQLLAESEYDQFEFSILTSADDSRKARAVQNQLNKEDNINVTLNQVPSSAYYSEFIKPHDFDTFFAGSGGHVDPDPSLYNFFRMHPEEGAPESADGVWNDGWYQNEEVHELIGEQRRTLDREERTEILHQIEDKLIADAPRAFVFHPYDQAAVSNVIKGFQLVGGTRYFHSVWLDE